MKHLLFALLACMLSSTTFAAQRDMSMSVEETFRQPTPTAQTPQNTNAGTGFDENVPLDPDMAKQMRDIQQRGNAQDNSIPALSGASPAIPGIAARRNFMTNFCDADYGKNIAGNTCQTPQRDTACQRFRKAPVEVQRLLDRAVNCEYAAASHDGMDTECDGLDANRLDLLKQYWQDEEVSYTILFLPDMVLNASAKCSPIGAKR